MSQHPPKPRFFHKPNSAADPVVPLPSATKGIAQAVKASLQVSALPTHPREFVFTAADFEKIRHLIHTHAGISLSDAKKDMVYSRLARRLRACGDTSFAQYLARLERDRTEWETFVNALTTNLTSFFREPHHFDTLAEFLRKAPVGRPARIWCCAASTGEEPYSLAITACEAFNTLDPPVRIVASDIDTQVLSQGQKGQYAADRLSRVGEARLRRFFLPKDPQGLYTVRPELQRLIQFQRINLLDARWPVSAPLDAIFCRNVMIYFDKPTQHTLLARFRPLLADHGLLFAGHSESFMHAAELFRSLGRTVYQKVAR
jgi:chemotaxis protein methyltransferase CheR